MAQARPCLGADWFAQLLLNKSASEPVLTVLHGSRQNTACSVTRRNVTTQDCSGLFALSIDLN
jgi:hypothetical protein